MKKFIVLLLIILTTSLFAKIKQELDLSYGTHPLQKLDVYWDTKVYDAAIFVNVHGGGWVGGDKSEFGGIEMAQYFAEANCILVSPNYRLFIEGQSEPTAEDLITDVWSAVAYIRRNAAQYNANPDKIFVGGCSAGGHLSAAVAYCQNKNWLAGTLYDGDMDAITAAVLGWWGESAAADYKVGILPTEHIDITDPPAFITHGTADPLVDIARIENFIAGLDNISIPYTYIKIVDGIHVAGHSCMWGAWENLTDDEKTAFKTKDNFVYYKEKVRSGLHTFITENVDKPTHIPDDYTNIAPGKGIHSSSSYASAFTAGNANDGLSSTLWASSTNAGAQWIYIDLGSVTEINGAVIEWYDSYFAVNYELFVCDDLQTWKRIYSTTMGNGGIDRIIGDISCRYIALLCKQKNSFAYALAEFEVLKL